MTRYWEARVRSFLFFLLFWGTGQSLFAQEATVCAQVQIEIQQELTLERQAFDAVMRINNGMTSLSLENVMVDVNFQDEDGNGVLASSDPNHPSAIFFVRVDQLDNISDVTGTGSVAPETTAEVHWLIIPTVDAANGFPAGKLYFVGATLSYTLDGEEQILDVTPDFITVKPLPELRLDYFLTRDVIADDPFTPDVVEQSEPYTLGVRVKNTGDATAYNLAIESAQPQITEDGNPQGLAIDFEIIGSSVDNQPAEPVLLTNFGQIASGQSKVARWFMTSTLAGEFIDFSATFTHADELGGDLTSIIEDPINTHILEHDVQVDLQGRDDVPDFLAIDNDIYRVYESNGNDTEVTDQSASVVFADSNLPDGGIQASFDFPAVIPGLVFARIADPYQGTKVLTSAVRADGKTILPANAWLSKVRDRSTSPASWDYYINIFDSDSEGSYTLLFETDASVAAPPTLTFIPDQNVIVGNSVDFLVQATDANGDVITLEATPLPGSASFTDNADGSANFSWTPGQQDIGAYSITYKATDATGLFVTQIASIIVTSASDLDSDGMDDAWELLHFGDLSRDGLGDYDGDGISDLQEFLDGTNPTVGTGLTMPEIELPLSGSHITDRTPDLQVANTVHQSPFDITYEFEIYTDPHFNHLNRSYTGVLETTNSTVLPVDVTLQDDTWYYWRVRAYDGHIYSRWNNARFFISTANDAPGRPAFIEYPLDGTEIATLTPQLIALKSDDVEQDDMTYQFDVYTDSAGTQLLFSLPATVANDFEVKAQVPTPLTDAQTYYWQTTVTDEHGLFTKSALSSFTVDLTETNLARPTIVSPTGNSSIQTNTATLIIADALNASVPNIEYFFEIDTIPTFDGEVFEDSDPVLLTNGEIKWLAANVIGQPMILEENQIYYWRAYAKAGNLSSPWVHGSLVADVDNSAPELPVIEAVANQSWAESKQPVFSVHEAEEVDGNDVHYYYEVYADAGLQTLISSYDSDSPVWSLPAAIENEDVVYWRVKADDTYGGSSGWSSVSAVWLYDDGAFAPPYLKLTNARVNSASVLLDWLDDDPDSSADIALYFNTSQTTTGGTLIAQGIAEDADGQADQYTWDSKWIPAGTYWLYGTISDVQSTSVSLLADALVLTDEVISLTGAGQNGFNQSAVLKVNMNNQIVYFKDSDGQEVEASGDSIVWSESTVSGTKTINIDILDAAGNLLVQIELEQTAGVTTVTDLQRTTIFIMIPLGDSFFPIPIPVPLNGGA